MSRTTAGWAGVTGRRFALRWAPLGFAVLLAGAAGWRARYGVDFSDSSHAVELALRMAQGDRPFRDEMNIQVLGSWAAVPFVWVWTHTAGLDGLVLASRLWFVALSLGVGALCWRAASPLLGRGTTAAALGVALIPAAYNQQVVSYNTLPPLLSLLAVCAGLRAASRRALGWGITAGAAAALGAVSHPVTTPAVVALLLVLLALVRGRSLLGVGAGVLAVALVVGALALFSWGPDNVRLTVDFTDDYQATRASHALRLGRWLDVLGGELAQPWSITALGLSLLAVVASLVRPLRPARGWLVALAVTAAVLQGVLRGSAGSTFSISSWLSPMLGTVLALVLLPPALAAGLARRGRTARVLLLGLVPTLVGMPFLAAYTSSAPIWGATAAALAPGLFAVTVASLAWVSEHGRAVKLAVAGVMVIGLGAVHAANSFRDGTPDELTAAVTDGAFAGLRTTPGRLAVVEENRTALGRCARPGDGVLAYIYPTAFLFGDVRFDTPIIWLDFFGSSNRYVLDWYDRTGRMPRCVVAAAQYWPGFGRGRYLREPDPLRDWVQEHYRVVTNTTSFVVLERVS